MAASVETGGRTGGGLAAYLLLFGALYGGYGALSPFLPAFLKERGLSPEQIATFLASATLARLVAGPLAGRLSDRTGRARTVLALGLALAAGLNLALSAGHGFPLLLALGLAQAVATAPLAPLADALALAAAGGGRAFAYGPVRAAGSAAFIAASALTGHLVAAQGSVAGLWACAAAFAAAALVAARVRRAAPAPGSERAGTGFGELLAIPRYRRLVAAAALVVGAHAMHDAFAVIVWGEAGIAPGTAGLLWSESVAAEVAVFLWAGPRLLARIGPADTIALAALAGALRWAVQAQTSWLPALAAVQVLHGLTFAALHLAALALIEESVPGRLRATALAVYGTFGIGLASALLTLAAGRLYAGFGPQGFWAMSALSLAAIPLALTLRGADGGRPASTGLRDKDRTNPRPS